jgi:hypothetical protein
MTTEAREMPEWSPDAKHLLKEAAAGLEMALYMLGQPVNAGAVYQTPASALREAAETMEWREAKRNELVRLLNELREAIK